jgi:hypothetical protein
LPRDSVERRKHLAEPWTITARRFTIADNRSWWNAHDWSSRGEEWTPSAEWKAGVVERLLIPQVPEGGTVVEIGRARHRALPDAIRRLQERPLLTD